MNIGEAAAAAGVSPKMIRHYEQIGLLPAADRTASGYRQYGPGEVSVLRFIRQARRLGFSIEQIGDLIGLWRDGSRASREVKALAEGHLATLEAKMREIAAMQQALQQLVASCAGDDDPHCAIIDGLAADREAPPQRHAPAAQRTGHAAVRPRPAAKRQPDAPHAELMAWTQALRGMPR